MRKLFVLLGLFGLFSSVRAQEQSWKVDMKAAVDEALVTNKPLLLFFTGSDWCGWCIRLQKEVFQTPEFTKWADEHVVKVALDYPRRTSQDALIASQNQYFQQLFEIRSFPTIWIVRVNKSKDNKIVFEKLGNTGYVAGGFKSWVLAPNQMITSK